VDIPVWHVWVGEKHRTVGWHVIKDDKKKDAGRLLLELAVGRAGVELPKAAAGRGSVSGGGPPPAAGAAAPKAAAPKTEAKVICTRAWRSEREANKIQLSLRAHCRPMPLPLVPVRLLLPVLVPRRLPLPPLPPPRLPTPSR
jgi:hypothetical protein